LIILEMNETHPARVRCQATCLNQQGTYNPAMALIIASQEQFVQIYGARDSFYLWDGLHLEVRTGNISYCDAQNNYTMDYEFLITSNSSEINNSVVVCGVNAFHDWSPYSRHICWGQSYGIITMPYNYATLTIVCCLSSVGLGSVVYPLMSTMVVIIILLMIILLLTVGFVRLRYLSRKRIAPQSVQTVEQT
jgi:hypothetical protein